jgi:hypothetical protein
LLFPVRRDGLAPHLLLEERLDEQGAVVFSIAGAVEQGDIAAFGGFRIGPRRPDSLQLGKIAPLEFIPLERIVRTRGATRGWGRRPSARPASPGLLLDAAHRGARRGSGSCLGPGRLIDTLDLQHGGSFEKRCSIPINSDAHRASAL